jgi:predicted membrane protein
MWIYIVIASVLGLLGLQLALGTFVILAIGLTLLFVAPVVYLIKLCKQKEQLQSVEVKVEHEDLETKSEF